MDRDQWDAIKKLGPGDPVRKVTTYSSRRLKRAAGIRNTDDQWTRLHTYRSPRRRKVVDDQPRTSQVFRAINRIALAMAKGRAS